jgi:hypothetical protein
MVLRIYIFFFNKNIYLLILKGLIVLKIYIWKNLGYAKALEKIEDA